MEDKRSQELRKQKALIEGLLWIDSAIASLQRATKLGRALDTLSLMSHAEPMASSNVLIFL